LTPFAQLTLIKTVLASVPGTATCRIGLEAAITADDYPVIRIVPTRLIPQEVGQRRQMELLIYFGAPLLEASDGLEAVYETLLEMEQSIKDALTLTVVKTARDQGQYLKTQYVETITDEDRLPHYKLFAMRWRVEG
jgi:ethanolamine ammonia-lyase small subunit